MYDGEAGFVESYKGVDVPVTRDNLRSATFFAGQGKKPLSYPERFKKQKEFGGSGGGRLVVSSSVGREFVGSTIHDRAQAGSNYVWVYKPFSDKDSALFLYDYSYKYVSSVYLGVSWIY